MKIWLMAYFILLATYTENNSIIIAKGLWENKKLEFYTQPKYEKYQILKNKKIIIFLKHMRSKNVTNLDPIWKNC